MITQTVYNCKSELTWRGCYSGTFDIWCPDAYSHPAKGSPALFFKIMEHLKELNLLSDGAVIMDPMAGICTTGIVASALGHPFIGVELESKFVELALKNKEYAERKLHKVFQWQIIQGDSRNLSNLLAERGVITLTSPPYIECGEAHSIDNTTLGIGRQDGRSRGGSIAHSYNVLQTPGQIGNLPDKPLVTVLSPPYGHDSTSHKGENEWRKKTDAVMHSGHGKEVFYSGSNDNIGNQIGENYLSAMSKIYAEIGKVSSVLAIVTKDPTRDKKIRNLSGDTIRILEETGWKVVCHHRSLLFEEIEQADLFKGSTKKVKGRLSFFKRLSWQKGSPVADHEDVLIAVRQQALGEIE